MQLTPSNQFTVSDGRPYNVTPDGTHYHPDTAPDLIEVLERLRRTRAHVRIFEGDPATGRVWDEEYDVFGRIGRSTGGCKVPLIVHPNSSGGPSLLDHRIVAVLTSPNHFAWKVPGFNPGRWTVTTDHLIVQYKGYHAASLRDGNLVGRHKTARGAQRFCNFMSGQRMAA